MLRKAEITRNIETVNLKILALHIYTSEIITIQT